MFKDAKCHGDICPYEYKRQEPAPRKGLAPLVLIFQTSPSCNIFNKILKYFRNGCQPSQKGLVFGRICLIFGRFYNDLGKILSQRADTKN